MYEINHNISSVKLGETICYHIGYLAIDREKRVHIGEKVLKTGKIKILYGELINDAVTIDKVAAQLYKCSTASWDEAQFQQYGTGEFILFQDRLGYLDYAYLAKRISNEPRIRKF